MGNITEDGRKERTVSLLQDVTFDLDDRITEWNREHDDNVSRSEIIDAMVQAFVWGRVPEEGTRMREILEYVSTADPAALTWDLDDSITEAHDDVSELINVALPALLWGEFPEADTPGGELLLGRRRRHGRRRVADGARLGERGRPGSDARSPRD